MKAENFRIGNLVRSHGSIIEIESINKICILGRITNPVDSFRETRLPYKMVEPIKLTEEWLFKFGFECEKEVIDGIENRDYCLEISDSSLNCEWTTEGFLDFVYLEGLDIKVLFVHQLQNLYFALTGDELKLNDHEIQKS